MPTSDATQHQLGDFLRSRRERLSPKPSVPGTGRKRRTPGLRREEVAELAGIGTDWYIRLEQGRSISPSVATLDALARALQLSKAEHAHLLTLRKSLEQRLFVRERVPPALQRMVEHLNPPAYVLGRRWDVLSWNAAADELFAFSDLCDADRNILLSMLTDPAAKRLFGAAWGEEAQRMLALFRTTHDLWAGDPAFIDLLGRLRVASPEFSGWWQAHEVRGIVAGSKSLNHPTHGALRFEYVTFQSNDDPVLKLVVYTRLPKAQ